MDLKSLLKPKQKKADIDPAQFASAVQGANAMNVRNDALKEIAMMGAGTLGLGMGLRGLAGLWQRTRPQSTDLKRLSGPAVLTFPIPEKEQKKKKELTKAADSKWTVPWYAPSMAMVGVGGLAGGWKTIDTMMKRERDKERETELDDARQQFHNALIAQYNTKQGAALGTILDRIYDLFEKSAGLKDIAQTIPGLYGTYAGLTALMSGALVYDQAVKKQRRKILEKAVRARQQKMFGNSPPEILAVPEMVPRQQMSNREESSLIHKPPVSLETSAI